MIPLEEKMLSDFGMSKFIVCTDAGLSSATNRVFNTYDKEDGVRGFYAVCTNLDDTIGTIIKANKHRWEIEECFRIMKTDFEARPVYLKRQDRIMAHFITCFIALIIYRYLKKKLDNKYIIAQILPTLQKMDFMKYEGKGYQPVYTRTEITDALHEAFGFCTSKHYQNRDIITLFFVHVQIRGFHVQIHKKHVSK